MLKFLFFSFVILFGFNANAVVKQSASRALSYRNIINDIHSSSDEKPIVAFRGALDEKKQDDPVIAPQKSEKVDMTTKDTMTIKLKKDDTVEISLKEGNDYSWKLNPTSSNLSLESDELVGDTRIIVYKLTSNSATSVYFDYVNRKDNNIEETKQLIVDLR